jgi:hypothetical protein
VPLALRTAARREGAAESRLDHVQGYPAAIEARLTVGARMSVADSVWDNLRNTALGRYFGPKPLHGSARVEYALQQ